MDNQYVTLKAVDLCKSNWPPDSSKQQIGSRIKFRLLKVESLMLLLPKQVCQHNNKKIKFIAAIWRSEFIN